MGKTALVEVDFQKSERIVNALEESGIPVVIAMWVHFPEYEDWRFVLASKELDGLDLGDAYSKINKALADADISVWQKPPIVIMKTTDSFVRALRKVFRKTKDVVGMRLGGQIWGDRFVEDAYAYKIA